MPQPDPFWICHQCGAQMRPLMIDGVAHCASCNSEFVEILDSEINPDPRAELPPPPPTRPGRAPSGPPGPIGPGARPRPSHPGYDEQAQAGGGGGLLGGLFNLFGGGGGASNSSDMPQPPRAPGQQPNTGGGRSWEWNFGNGAVRVQGFSGPMPRQASPFGNPFLPPGPNPWVGGFAGAPGNPNQGLDAFFRGFGAPPRSPGQGPGRGAEPLGGADLLQALMQIVMEEGGQPIPLGPNGQLGDYVMTERGFNDILERLMQATGPQGPLPASRDTIDHLERFTFTEKTLVESHYKDCSICMDDFKAGDEAMKIPCGHAFHPDCLTPWLETNGSCPVCRYSLVPEDGEPGAPGTGAAAAAEGGAGRGTAEGSASAAPQPAAPQGALAGAQGAITSVLNRLFGQAGAADSAAPTSPPAQPSSGPAQPSSQPASTAPTDPADDPPDAPLIDFDTPVRGPRTPTPGQPRRALPEWAQLARGMQPPGARSDVDTTPASTQQSGSGFGSTGLVPPNDLFDSDVAQYRATAGAGDIAQIPWNAPNHQHVEVRYAVVGGEKDGEAEEDADADLPRLFCHAVGAPSIGDFSLLQLRRVAARAGVAPVVEGRMCVHAVGRDIAGEAEMGRVMRECRGAGGGAGGGGDGGEGRQGEAGASLSYSGERPGSIAPEDVD